MNCPNFNIESVRDEFNKLVIAAGGEPLTIEEFKNKDLRNKRSGVDDLAMQVAYRKYDSNTNPNAVNYSLKSVNILLSDKAKQVFAKGEKNKWLATNKGGDFDSSDVGKKLKSSIQADLSNWTIDQQNNQLKERAKLYGINLPSNYLYTKSWQNKFKEGGKLTAEERIAIEKAKGKDRMEIQNAKSMSKYREKDIESKEKILSEMSSLTRELILNAIK